MDSNHDGKISAEEITAQIQEWADSKVGRMSISCLITCSGQPLPGATVRFVPEKFLGDAIKAAEGTTDRFGVAIMKSPAGSGVCPGFYRVEITKNDETIPGKYNTETQLGQEVAPDAASSGPLKFEVKD